MITVILHLHAVRREGIEVRDRRIEPEFRRGIRLQLQHLLDKRNVAVLDRAIGDHMHELACDKTADLRQHVHKHGILHDIPVVCRKRIL